MNQNERNAKQANLSLPPSSRWRSSNVSVARRCWFPRPWSRACPGCRDWFESAWWSAPPPAWRRRLASAPPTQRCWSASASVLIPLPVRWAGTLPQCPSPAQCDVRWWHKKLKTEVTHDCQRSRRRMPKICTLFCLVDINYKAFIFNFNLLCVLIQMMNRKLWLSPSHCVF